MQLRVLRQQFGQRRAATEGHPIVSGSQSARVQTENRRRMGSRTATSQQGLSLQTLRMPQELLRMLRGHFNMLFTDLVVDIVLKIDHNNGILMHRPKSPVRPYANVSDAKTVSTPSAHLPVPVRRRTQKWLRCCPSRAAISIVAPPIIHRSTPKSRIVLGIFRKDSPR